jgi:hypothetical protein
MQAIIMAFSQPNETEWLEFKHDNDNPEMIGKYISALSNSAAYVHYFYLYSPCPLCNCINGLSIYILL